jgi:hypothetical protein
MRLSGKEKEALRKLLEMLGQNPEILDRITITIRPNAKRPPQGEDKE